ncbi:MAG: 30S ribosomal protein S16, partial [Candidatus Marinimicrobia bacterium]|nr:30S ribosomal protein S16 [Candidatus Neomarinimicrobiota bacterium]
MATKIRLKRIGRRNRPFYRLVIMDSRNRRDGAAIEQVGWYNPIADDDIYSLKEDRILHWLKEGAQPTNAAQKLFKKMGVAYKWHLMQSGLDESAIEKELKKWELDKEAANKSLSSKKDEAVKKDEVVKKDEAVK